MLHNDACPRDAGRSADLRRVRRRRAWQPASRRTCCRWPSGTCCDDTRGRARSARGRSPWRGAGRHRRAGRLGQDRADRAAHPALRARGVDLAVITNDLVTEEDAERIRRSGLIDPERVRAVETGACPHTAIREDPTLNMQSADELERSFPGLELILIESGGDNLASTFSLDLVDYWMFVIDVAGGDDIPRKRGPGVLACDLLVINKSRPGALRGRRSRAHAARGGRGAPRAAHPAHQLRDRRGRRRRRRAPVARGAVP